MQYGRLFAFLSLAALACSGPGEATDAGPDVIYGKKPLDAGGPEEAEAAAKTPDNRLTLHGGGVLAGAHVRAIYVGTQGVDLSPSFDTYLAWLVTSTDYWGAYLAQYGVGYEIFDGATNVSSDAFFTPGMLQNGVVEWFVLDKRIRALVHGQSGDAGADASDEAGADASDEGGADASPVQVPLADAYVFFLPDGVNVDLGGGSATCTNAGGYHAYDGAEPYAIIPACGRYRLVVSHEMAEMATDPVPDTGWYSNVDQGNAGGEIGDICNSVTTVDNQQVTQLWSNKDGDCEPP